MNHRRFRGIRPGYACFPVAEPSVIIPVAPQLGREYCIAEEADYKSAPAGFKNRAYMF